MIVLTRRLVMLARMLVFGAGAVTALSIAAIVSLQIGFWFMTKTWSPFPVSRIFELSDMDVPRRYGPASIETSGSSRLGNQNIVEWLLDFPAIVALFVALALLALSYASLTAVERALATVSGVAPGRKDS